MLYSEKNSPVNYTTLGFTSPASSLEIIITSHNSLALCILGNFFLHAFLSSADFFQNQLFQKTLSGIPSECQAVWIQIRPDILSGLIWIQTVCKGEQQTEPVGKELVEL